MHILTKRKCSACVIASRQIVMLKRLIKEIDEKAFVILADAREVLGEALEKIKK